MTENFNFKSNSLLHLGYLTNRIGRLLSIRLMNRLGAEQFDMPGHCLGILADLHEKDGVIQNDLAISVVKDKATIARALDLMEKKNIIVRIKDERDKRNKKIFLTYKGKELQGRVMFHGAGMMKDLQNTFTKKEMEHCLKTLDKIYIKLNDKS